MFKWINSQSKIIKIILFIPIYGFVFSALYCISSYLTFKKDITTLIVGICLFIPFIGFFFAITDLIKISLNEKITLFCDNE